MPGFTKQDADIKSMNEAELRKEVMRLRKAIRKWRDNYDNALCHEEDDKLALVLPEKQRIYPISLSQIQFERNCVRFATRKARDGKFPCQKHGNPISKTSDL